MCFSFTACGGKNKSPEERLPEAVQEYLFENYRIKLSGATSTPVSVDIKDALYKSENEWAVIGTYTVKISGETMSAKFGLVAEYNSSSDTFSFSNVQFDDFI